MTMPVSDPTTMMYVIGGLFTTVGATGGLLYRGTHGRIRRVEDTVEKKADQKDLERQHEASIELFRKVDTLRADMNGGFASIRDTMNANMLTVIERLPRKDD